KYFNFDNKQTAKSDKKKQQKQILLAVLLVGLGYYFFIYLPENQKQQENENSQSDNAKSLEELEKELQEDAKLKADKEVKKIASTLIKKYQEEASIFPDGDRNEKFYFSRAASYNIHFPFALREHYIKGKEAEQENFEYNPIRGETDKNKRDNNAIFYGAPGTGKTRTIQNICYTANRYPLVEIKGSALTPTKEDQDSKLLPLKKFVYTINEADQISNNALTHDPTKLRFLKECLEGVDQSARREFKKYAEQFGIINQFPQRWIDTTVLNIEDNK
ncbi:6374_t:CDS:2, partial [Funneliformis geosporum]